MKLVECPICDSKFNIEKVPDGTKLKCSKCQKIFGVIKNGDMVPVGLTQTHTQATSAKTQYPINKSATKPQSQRTDTATPSPASRATRMTARPSRIQQAPAKPRPKPSALMYVGGLTSLIAIGMFIYVYSIVSTPKNTDDNRRNIKSGTKVEKTEKPEPKDTDQKEPTE